MKSTELENRIKQLEAKGPELEKEITDAEELLGNLIADGLDTQVQRALVAALRAELEQLPRAIQTVKKRLNEAILEETDNQTATLATEVEKLIPGITRAADDFRIAVDKFNNELAGYTEKLKKAGLHAPEETILNLSGGRGLPGTRIADVIAQTRDLSDFLAERVRYRVIDQGREKRSYVIDAGARRLRG